MGQLEVAPRAGNAPVTEWEEFIDKCYELSNHGTDDISSMFVRTFGNQKSVYAFIAASTGADVYTAYSNFFEFETWWAAVPETMRARGVYYVRQAPVL